MKAEAKLSPEATVCLAPTEEENKENINFATAKNLWQAQLDHMAMDHSPKQEEVVTRSYNQSESTSHNTTSL